MPVFTGMTILQTKKIRTEESPSGRIDPVKIKYYSDTDSLYIDLTEKKAVDSREVDNGIIFDFDQKGHLAGIDIDEASKHLYLKELLLRELPSGVKTLAGKPA